MMAIVSGLHVQQQPGAMDSQYAEAETDAEELATGTIPVAADTPLLRDRADSFQDPSRRKGSIYWLLPAFLFIALAFGASLAPRINLLISLVCKEYQQERFGSSLSVIIGGNNEECRIPEVQARAARLSLTINLVSAALSAYTTARYGAWSDRVGRKKVILLSAFGALCNDIIIIAVARYFDILGTKFLIVGAFIDGLLGSFTTGMAATNAYASDCTKPDKRAVAFGYISGSLFLGIAIGPVVGAYLIKAFGDVIVVFYASLIVHIAYIIYAWVVLPESLSERRMATARAAYSTSKIQDEEERSRVGSFWQYVRHLNVFKPISIFFLSKEGTSARLRRNFLLLAYIDIVFILNMGAFSIVVLYPTYVFGWQDLEQGYYLSIVGSTRVFILLVVLPLIMRYFRSETSDDRHGSGADRLDIWIVRAAAFVETIGYASKALAGNTAQYYLASALAASAGFGSPALQSALIKHVPKEKTGELLGALSVLQSISRVVTPTVLGLIYSWTVGTDPRAVLYVMTGAMCSGFIFSWFVRAGYSNPLPRPTNSRPE
ncbi:hypothetical protein G7K_5652-t1 [Saitoella complicata NRRL Y-17804]|uniref:Major facilitator superfamily (MFS) profile domain-containing protein n=1 Tax=Saitoella complicata (strain BCRC 22490 / CBS 7301 / JCM 7358 / NBRC 10748 / NRRL Y-17804) TaxID=698492 RepID=A0A0E9NP23_SAICN|nr:hypothetical protein G7K_5652-t1 [Saitoella complicata NRRL Y-17804]